MKSKKTKAWSFPGPAPGRKAINAHLSGPKPSIELWSAENARAIGAHMTALVDHARKSPLVRHWLQAHEQGLFLGEGEEGLIACSDLWDRVSQLILNTTIETLTPQQRYCPDYDCDMPVRDGWVDGCYEGMSPIECPRLCLAGREEFVIVFCDYLDPDRRDHDAQYTFRAWNDEEDENPVEFETDDWSEMSAFLDRFEGKVK